MGGWVGEMDTWIDEQTEGLVVGRWMDDRQVGSWVDGSMNSCFSW